MNPSAGPKTILIVDDSPTVRQFAEESLVAAGYTVSQAASGVQSLEQARRQRPDLVLLDYRLGNELGTDVSKLFANQPELAKVPIVLMSAKEDALGEVGKDAGSVVDFLTKPFVKSTLLAVVEEALPKPPPATEEESSLMFLEQEIQRIVGSDSPGTWDPRTLGIKKIGQIIFARLQKNLAQAIRDGFNFSRDKLARTITSRVLDGAFIDHLSREIHETVVSRDGQGFAASAEMINLSDLLQSLANKQLNGILTVMSAQNAVEMHLFSGTIRFLNPRRVSLPFHQDTVYCNSLAFTVEYLQEALARTETEDGSIFFQMLQDKVLSLDHVTDTMTAFSMEVLRECLTEAGTCWFQFTPKSCFEPKFLEFAEDIPVQRFMLSLFSEIDEWVLFKKTMIESGAVFAPTPLSMSPGSAALSRRQLLLLQLLDGRSGVLDIAASCRLSPFDVCRGVQSLIHVGLVRKVQKSSGIGAKSPPPAPLPR